jgi:hypothetical protein
MATESTTSKRSARGQSDGGMLAWRNDALPYPSIDLVAMMTDYLVQMGGGHLLELPAAEERCRELLADVSTPVRRG